MGLSKIRAIHLYDKTLQMATEDGVISEDEVGILLILAQTLGLTEDERAGAHLRIRTHSQDDDAPPSEVEEGEIYRAALIAALHDERVSDDEIALLQTLAQVMNLGDTELRAAETMVRSEVNEGIEGSRLDRLERVLSRNDS